MYVNRPVWLCVRSVDVGVERALSRRVPLSLHTRLRLHVCLSMDV